MMAVCPKCDVALILLEFLEIQVDYCPRCEGLWLDAGEVEQLIERTGGVAANPVTSFFHDCERTVSGRPDYLCPRCDRRLREVARVGYGGEELRVDRCPRGDGIWFDKYELQLLLKSLPPDVAAQGAIALLSDVLGDYAKHQEGIQ